MQDQINHTLIDDWQDELISALMQAGAFCIALFDENKNLLFANKGMTSLLKDNPADSFIHPNLDDLLAIPANQPLVFNGFMTMGDNKSINTSIEAQVFRKADKILILGGINTSQLIEQNAAMHSLNREIGNLQRQLMKEKFTLEKTLGQLNMANSKLQQMNNDKDRFISILAHDLKNPFSSLIGFANLLKQNLNKYDMPKIERMIKTIGEIANSAFVLLEELLLWVRSNSGLVVCEPSPLRIGKVIETMITQMSYIGEKKNHTISQQPGDDCLVYADLNMLDTVLRNLLTNAVKFTPENGRIEFSWQQINSHVEISVTDSGIGISPAILPQLFNLSYKVTTPGTAGERGTGLGLIICKEFIEKNNGKIWVESTQGQGSSFKFTLPVYEPKTGSH